MLPAVRVVHSESIFFCIRAALGIRDEIVSAASTLARTHGLPGRLSDASLAHISLCGIGRPKQQREPLPVIVRRVGDAIQFPQFELTLSEALGFKQGSRGFPNVLLPDEKSTRMLCLLNEALRKAQLFNGLMVPKSFTPHLTLTRSSDHWPYSGSIAPISWLVTEFELVHSYHDGRRIHDVLECFPLLKASDRQP
jgi:2'-5' RNA ligase